jgi:hypothetical protein
MTTLTNIRIIAAYVCAALIYVPLILPVVLLMSLLAGVLFAISTYFSVVEFFKEYFFRMDKSCMICYNRIKRRGRER